VPRLALVGLGCAWFALGVAGIVALGRMEFFAGYPDQIFANRYVPWSCLFWFGLLAGAIGLRAQAPVAGAANPVDAWGYAGAAGTWSADAHRAAGPGLGPPGVQVGAAAPSAANGDRLGRTPRWVWLPACVMLVMAVLTTPSHRIWSEIVQQGVCLDSAGFVSGVIDPQRSLGETIAEEVIAGLPAIRGAGLSAFAWPEARRVGTPAAPAVRVEGIEVLKLAAAPVGNRLGGGATQIQVQVRRNADVPMPARLLVEVDGVLVGVLVRQTVLPGWSWAGYVPQPVGPTQLRLHALAADGTLHCWTGCADRR
jgi:hypothetical protein